MRAIVVYESMFGHTRAVAEAIGTGLEAAGASEVRVLNVGQADPPSLVGADLVVVGGPTHAWGMSRPSTRKNAPDYVAKSKGAVGTRTGG